MGLSHKTGTLEKPPIDKALLSKVEALKLGFSRLPINGKR
jgi:hypothetical protein